MLSLCFIISNIAIYLNINKSTSDTVSAFINKFKSNPSLKVEYYKKLSANKNIIPVLSYNSRSNYIQGSFKTDLMMLKKNFNRVAFRIYNTKDFQLMLNDINDVISAEDTLIYDLDTKLHNQPKIITNYNKVNALKDSVNFTSVLVRSAINREVVFKDLTNGAIVVSKVVMQNGKRFSLITEPLNFPCFYAHVTSFS
jgi:hypothetical protein